jgi:hypothetical protein
MKISRTFAFPSRHTFTIKPIKRLLARYVGDGIGWIDPFAGDNSIAEITNDLNPNKPTTYHFHAKEFVNILDEKYNGILFDPPYSLTQVKQCYNSIGAELFSEDYKYFFGNIKTIIAPKIKLGGYAICFGWNSNGFDKKRGFIPIEILLVSHGRNHNDTIVTVERKIRETLFENL